MEQLAQPPDDLEADGRLLVRAAREPEAFAVVYERFYQVILDYTFRRTLSISAAEELTSNTFFKALRSLPQQTRAAGAGRPIRPWLYRIATNELKMHWRWRSRHPALSLESLLAEHRVFFDSDETAAREEAEERMSEFARLHAALERLPEKYRTIIALRYHEHLTLEQIAQVIDKPIGSVKSRLHRARARLRIAAGGSDRPAVLKSAPIATTARTTS